jgi:membrane-bound serine protease (ClpP class)
MDRGKKLANEVIIILRCLMMRKRIILITSIIWIGIFIGSPTYAQGEQQIFLLEAQGPLTPTMVEYLERGIRQAENANAEALIFKFDTPGGQIDHMNRMVQAIRGSEVPVVVYIAPRGAIAGSAGLVIVLSGHVAAMAPETAIGASSPVGGQGEDLGETIETKEKEILKAEVRALTTRRGDEAVALAESAIEEAKAATVEEAFQVGMIDIIADDMDDLLTQLNGWDVQLASGERTIQTSNVEIVQIEQNFIEQLLQTLTNPNIVFILFTVGVQAILIEISSPGGWVAGFIGVVCLALGTYGIGVLPVNWFGLIFLATSFVLFFLDIKAPTHGALTIAGLASFIVGALVLFNSPGTPDFQRVSVPLVIGAAIFTAACFFAIITFAIRAQRRPVQVGAEALIGEIGRARSNIDPSGKVHVAGELWSVELDQGASAIEEGQLVEIVGVKGLRLLVRSSKEDVS